jgi:hypothetical protein
LACWVPAHASKSFTAQGGCHVVKRMYYL